MEKITKKRNLELNLIILNKKDEIFLGLKKWYLMRLGEKRINIVFNLFLTK